MFGRLLDYRVDKNIINVNYEENQVEIRIISDNVVNFFSPLHRKERNSKAIENITYENTEFSVTERENCIVVKMKNLTIEVHDDFKVDIYDKDGEILCRDYRGHREPFIRRGNNLELASEEGHVLNGHEDYKVYVAKTMEEDMYFYGLGERTGALNKKGK
ncbi:MAG: DUF4968 domain-containing protein, partial [Clostridium sartagoforme]|nr:DUF4968 domain-containing protein [Clostridium sartagoforme]